jgi:hypothetical protein
MIILIRPCVRFIAAVFFAGRSVFILDAVCDCSDHRAEATLLPLYRSDQMNGIYTPYEVRLSVEL